MAVPPEELAWRREFGADRCATDIAREMSRLRDRQPRPLAKLYGRQGPTPEQRVAWETVNKQYNRMMGHLRKVHKVALARDNACVRR